MTRRRDPAPSARVRTSLAGIAFLWAACNGPATFPPLIADPDGALAALETETGHHWTLRRHPRFGTPAYLEGRTAPMAATPRDAERAARQFLSQHPALFSLRDADAELATIDSDSDELGRSRARYTQRVGRIPVWGSTISVHFDADGSLIRMSGHYTALDGPGDLLPQLGADQARVNAAVLARRQRPASDPSSISTTVADLFVFPLEDADLAAGSPRPARLAWHVVATVADAQPPLQLETLFDAQDGALLFALDRVETVVASGVGVFGDRKPIVVEQKTSAYWLEDRTRGETPLRTFSAHGRTRLPGTELRSTALDQWDADPADGLPGAGVDAHAYLAQTWDYFEHAHGRSGWDGQGGGIRAVVHFGDHYGNAFFDGAQLVFGDGDDAMTSPAAALDVVAHEYTHGLIAATAGLLDLGEPGAIDEGLADLFGCLVAWNSGQGARWQIGETVYHPTGLRNHALRDLEDPHRTGQPSRVQEIATALDDRGDLHTNASIVGHLGYLLAEGAPGDDHELPIAGLGVDRTGKLIYRTLTRYLFSRAGFADLADALEASAQDLDQDAAWTVRQALQRVGLR